MKRSLFSLPASAVLTLFLAAAANGQTFSNSTPIGITDFSPATLYPSSIDVSGPIGNIAEILVTLTGFSHTYPQDCLFVLVAPDGRAYSLFSHCGSGDDVNNIILTFSPDAASALSNAAITGGTYLPSFCANYGSLAAPAPPGPYLTGMTGLFGTSPIGTWSLYIADQAYGDIGQIAGGWSISFDTLGPVSPSSASAFTYQGKLKNASVPVQGNVQVRYRLIDAAVGGSQVGPARILTETLVDGVFTTLLDFGSTAFAGGASRWLELTVGSTVLTPRQAVTGAPLAIEARHALAADTATSSNNTRGITVDNANHVGVFGGPAAGAVFTATSYSGTPMLDQSQTTSATTPFNVTGTIWQSFTPAIAGQLSALVTRNGVITAWSGTLSIYSGVGVGGPLLLSQPVSSPAGLNPTFNLNSSVLVVPGNQYTFAFTNAPGSTVRVDAGTNVYAGGVCSVANTFDLWFQTYVSRLAPTLIVSENGRVGINTTSPTQALTVNGNVLANNVAVPSSIRFKDRVYPLDDALANLMKLSGVRFDWKPEYAAVRGFTHDLGFVAEDVEKVFPEVVMHDGDGKVIGMDYSRLTAVAVQAIKQQQAQIERLKTEAADVERLRTENAQIKGRLEAIEALLRDRK